jgi:hypothetical protein
MASLSKRMNEKDIAERLERLEAAILATAKRIEELRMVGIYQEVHGLLYDKNSEEYES